MLILASSRQQEIMSRARNRLVTAMICMQAPQDEGESLSPEAMGVFMHGIQSRLTKEANQLFAKGAHFWQFGDYLATRIEKDPRLLATIMEELAKRTSSMGELDLSAELGAQWFESEDLVEKAMGIPLEIRVDFNDVSSEQATLKIENEIPFNGLKDYLHILNMKLAEIEGSLFSVDITHAPLTNAHDMYGKPQGHGLGFAVQDLSLHERRMIDAYNILSDVGVGVADNKPKFH